MKHSREIKALTQASVIAALYVVMTYLSALLGLSGGVIQLRLSEMLCVLPVFSPSAVPGLTVGCVIANLLTGSAPWDVVFGALATFLGAVGTRLLRNHKRLSVLPPFISNTLIIPFILRYAYGAEKALPFLMVSVGAGEAVMCIGGGSLLLFALDKRKRLFK